MRKASQDGGDSTSITSGVENEVKKSAMKPKNSSLKRKPPVFNNDSDDTIVEPLLPKDKQKMETTPSAKYIIKGKTVSLQNKGIENNTKTTSMTTFCGTTESLLSLKDSKETKTNSDVPIHNYMNTNVFNSHDKTKVNVSTKSQMLVEIDGNKQSGYDPSPLIFTTAKIHTDGKSKNMEPVQVTPVPILSTTEVSLSKGGSFTTNEKKISNGSSVINSVYSPVPLSKVVEEKSIVSTSRAVTSSNTSKDTFSKTITTSMNKLSNNILVQSSCKENNLPSTTKSITIISNTKDKQASFNDIQKEKEKIAQPSLKPFTLDGIKNTVTVKNTTPLSEKVDLVDITTKSTKNNQSNNQTDNKLSNGAQINKLDTNFENQKPINVCGNESQNFATSVKTLNPSKNSIEISNIAKNVGTSAGSKQLQRQKTTTDETSIIKSQAKLNTESLGDSGINSIFINDNDKLPQTSVNNTQHLNKKSTINTIVNLTTNVTSISTTNPTATNMSSSNTMTTSTNIPSKSFTASLTNFGKSTTETSTNALSDISKTSTIPSVTTGSTTISKSSEAIPGTCSVISKSISTEKSPKMTSTLPTSSVVKSVLAKTPSTTTVVIKTTSTTASYSKASTANAIKSPPSGTSTTITAINQPNQTAVKKSPSVTTSINSPSVSSIATTNTSSNISKKTANTKLPATSLGLSTSMKAPVATTSTAMTTESSISSKTKISQNITSAQGSTNKRPITTTSINTITKIPTVAPSVKPSTANSGNTNTATVKFPNNNSSQISATSKPSTTSTAKTTPSVITLAKTSVVSPSTSVATTLTTKTPQAISSITIAASSTSAKKPLVTKAQAVTAKSSRVSSVNNSIVGNTTKAPSSVVVSTPTTTNKQPDDKTVLIKTPSITTSMKTSSVITSATTSSVTSVSSTSAAVINPTAKNAPQVSTNKTVDIAGPSVPSSTPVLRLSETITKKGGSKSSENNKDGEVSKA